MYNENFGINQTSQSKSKIDLFVNPSLILCGSSDNKVYFES